jgi:hypothetical protein
LNFIIFNDYFLKKGVVQQLPMLSPNFFKVAEKYIDASKKPIILYAFY